LKEGVTNRKGCPTTGRSRDRSEIIDASSRFKYLKIRFLCFHRIKTYLVTTPKRRIIDKSCLI
jgi:hypothetical protein